MMKYPYELSESRLSLLSRQELNRYKYEHSEYFDYTEKLQAINEFLNAYKSSIDNYYQSLLESSNDTELNEDELHEIAESEAKYQAEYLFASLDSILQPIMEEGGFTAEEYKQLSEAIQKELMMDEFSLNEDTVGPDQTFWAKGLGKYVSAGFGAVFAGMAGLIMAGKTKAAIHKLEEYMNELVELCDDGINKQRSIFKRLGDGIKKGFNKLKSFFKKKDKNKGDQSYASFREVQENYLSTLATKAMVLTKNMGFVSENIDTAISEIEENSLSKDGTGMGYFNQNLCFPVTKLVNKN